MTTRDETIPCACTRDGSETAEVVSFLCMHKWVATLGYAFHSRTQSSPSTTQFCISQ